jgi:hypothetical protein
LSIIKPGQNPVTPAKKSINAIPAVRTKAAANIFSPARVKIAPSINAWIILCILSAHNIIYPCIFIILALYPKICYVFSLCDNFGIIYKKAIAMRFCLVILSFFLFGCQVVDTIAVPINNTANNLSNSSNLYEDNQTNTSLHMGKSGLVLEKEF